jgi:hypothetical protein
MTKLEIKLKKIICGCIKELKTVWFYYESSSGNYYRKVEPYILAIKDRGKGNIFFTGYSYPSKKQNKKIITIIKVNIY